MRSSDWSSDVCSSDLIVLGAETGSLLVGEGATARDLRAIKQAIEAHPDVERIIHIKTLYIGPEELMIGAKLAFASNYSLAIGPRAMVLAGSSGGAARGRDRKSAG